MIAARFAESFMFWRVLNLVEEMYTQHAGLDTSIYKYNTVSGRILVSTTALSSITVVCILESLIVMISDLSSSNTNKESVVFGDAVSAGLMGFVSGGELE